MASIDLSTLITALGGILVGILGWYSTYRKSNKEQKRDDFQVINDMLIKRMELIESEVSELRETNQLLLLEKREQKYHYESKIEDQDEYIEELENRVSKLEKKLEKAEAKVEENEKEMKS